MAALALYSPPAVHYAAPRRRALHRCCAAAAAEAAIAPLAGPPVWYDHRAATAEASAAVAAAHPSLAPLVCDGLLLALPRPASYAERRDDGYEEPHAVWLLGTAHLSQRSAADVASAVAALAPDAVVVELCRSRAGVMYAPADEAAAAGALAMGGESFAAAMQRSVRLGGGGALLLRALLRAAAARASGSAAAEASLGAEFAAAARAAEATGATLVLGDRPVEVTLKRALQAASAADRLRVARLLLPLVLPWVRQTQPAVSAAALDALLLDEDAISALFARFAADFPSLAAPLVHERDAYLAWSACRSKAVCGKRGVLAVIGAGHLRGVAWAVQNANGGAGLRFDALVGRQAPDPPLWRRLATDAALLGATAAAWAAVQPVHNDAGL